MASPFAKAGQTPGELLRSLGLHPSKALGQHFLHDRGIVQRIVATSGIGPDNTVIEIGPGLGVLTGELSRAACRVVAIEKDARLADHLRTHAPANVEVIHADALDIDPAEVGGSSYHIVANLPYSVANAIVRHLLESEPSPATLTVMVQREVAERMVDSPPDMSVLSVAVQFYGDPKIAFRIGKGAFVPPPNVESAVVRIVTQQPPLPTSVQPAFFRLVRAGFSQRRKQIVNSIAAGLGMTREDVARLIAAAGLSPSDRAERLTVNDWLLLFEQFETVLGER